MLCRFCWLEETSREGVYSPSPNRAVLNSPSRGMRNVRMGWTSLIDGRSRTNQVERTSGNCTQDKEIKKIRITKNKELDRITAVTDSRNVESKRANSPNFPHSTNLLSSRAFPLQLEAFPFARLDFYSEISFAGYSSILVVRKKSRIYVRPRQKLVRQISTAQGFMSTLQA